jgi:hypothetical protein
MSMWLNLAKISPELMREIRERPELIEVLFFDEDLPGFDSERDVYGYDYRLLNDIADGRAKAEGETDWRTVYTWMAEATGESGAELEGYEFAYGPAFLLDPSRVARVAKGLMGEGWGFKARSQHADYEEFDDLGPFFAAAVREGKAVVGGIS